MLAHSDFADVNYYAVAGAYGNQSPKTEEYWTPKFRETAASYLENAMASSNSVAKAWWIEADVNLRRTESIQERIMLQLWYESRNLIVL